ncbi:DUF2189 domain-containing protein [Teichococcus aestuarii]|uniref:DUF2189 domain-containing protein n=1 Tax=Teichococcus aestuarii TaxID=568898 RepID=UPI003617263E
MPLFWPLVSGFTLLGPVAALGVYELSRRREQGQPTRWTDALAVRHSPALTSIIGLGVLLLAIFVAWIFTARAIYGITLGDTPATATDFLSRVLYSREGHQLMLLGNLAGFLFAVLVFSLTVVSFPMLLDRAGRGLPVNARMAMRASLRAVRTNPGPLALWGFLIALLLALGSLPLFVGLAVVVPVLGHATGTSTAGSSATERRRPAASGPALGSGGPQPSTRSRHPSQAEEGRLRHSRTAIRPACRAGEPRGGGLFVFLQQASGRQAGRSGRPGVSFPEVSDAGAGRR